MKMRYLEIRYKFSLQCFLQSTTIQNRQRDDLDNKDGSNLANSMVSYFTIRRQADQGNKTSYQFEVIFFFAITTVLLSDQDKAGVIPSSAHSGYHLREQQRGVSQQRISISLLIYNLQCFIYLTNICQNVCLGLRQKQ